MAKADDILRDAIIGTENEIFAEGFDKDELTLDETGDRSLEAMGDGLEGQREPDDEEEDEGANEGADETDPEEEGEAAHFEEADEAKAKAAETKPEEASREQHGRVPAGRLRAEAEQRRAVEAERDRLKAELEAKDRDSQKAISDLNAKFEGVLAAMRQQPLAAPKTEPAQPETPPDLFEDPKAFVEHLQKGFETRLTALQTQMHNERVNQSLEGARARHGATFEAAFTALKAVDFKNPDNAAMLKRMEFSPNPGEALVAWHRRNETLREVGDDPATYKARVAEEARKSLMADPEFRKQILEDLRGEAMTGDNGRPRTETRLPRSLNKTPGGNMRAPNDLEIFDGSDDATFKSAWT